MPEAVDARPRGDQGLHERVARRDHLLGGGRGLDHVDLRPRAPLLPGAPLKRLGRLRAIGYRLGRGLRGAEMSRHRAIKEQLKHEGAYDDYFDDDDDFIIVLIKL